MILHFNSHAHVERDALTLFKEVIIANFNSHAHVERDMNRIQYEGEKQISTHTLTWSVTNLEDNMWKVHLSFQLTRSRGA